MKLKKEKGAIIENTMMTAKDIKEYHKMIKELKEQVKRYGQKENEELDESYKESRRQQKERDDKKK